MRTQALLRPTCSLLQRRATFQCALFSSTYPRYPRKDLAVTRSASRTHKRSSSSATPVAPPPESEPAAPSAASPGDPNDDVDRSTESEKPKRRKSTKPASDSDKDAAPTLPLGLDILWNPSTNAPSPASTLPPPEILQEALNNLLITLHPQTQHRATYVSSAGLPVEPTLALYCPIEGGDYIIDETVRELARRTGSDVVVLDAVQLAAGEWGLFGKAASVLQLPQNPLHFRSSPPRSPKPFSPAQEEEEEESDFSYHSQPSQMTLHVMAHGTPVRASRQSVFSPAARGSPESKAKLFFDELVNISANSGTEDAPSDRCRPRLIYVRDFPTLAPSASTWYPPLLSAVRQRRQGPIARPSSPINNSVTIVFGVAPSIIPPDGHHGMGGPQGMLGLIMNRHATTTLPGFPQHSMKSDYGEDDGSNKARERRLRRRLRKWERGDPSLQDELPSLPHTSGESSGTNGVGQRSGIVILGPGGMGMGGMDGLPPGLASALQARSGGREGEPGDNSQFFRSSVLVPAARSPQKERACRISRRREINELTMRMGVGAVGGALSDVASATVEDTSSLAVEEGETADKPPKSDWAKMWDEWGTYVEAWANVKVIADRAMGTVVASNAIDVISSSKSPLVPTPIPWSAVVSAWLAQRASRDIRKAWIQQSSGKSVKEQQEEDEEDEEGKEGQESPQDEVVQQVKQDPDLTPHEQRLLGCIIDSASMPTSFSQVHLPPHTIDSVRTIVSLPLLHPSAFQQGILKQHSMTGCLLFGPPGTGKTLVVRALAKEAGCRMMSVSPSDVMDMYVGEGEKLVRSLFSLARRLSPCVIFLDEIDALFGARMSARESGGAIAHRGVITEFMQEMDGLKTNKDSNVIVIGATNRPFDLDDAVLRRLPRRLLVDLPGENERAGILKILLRDEILSDEVNLQALAKRTELFSGSDLKHLCVSAALHAVKERVTVPWDTPHATTAASPVAAIDESSNPGTSAVNSGSAQEATDTSTPIEPSGESSASSSLESTTPFPSSSQHTRILHLYHFNKALKEITPSSSESLGSLSALRKWNEEFGEGQKKKRKIMWGKGLFGFAESGTESVQEGHVSNRDAQGTLQERSDTER